MEHWKILAEISAIEGSIEFIEQWWSGYSIFMASGAEKRTHETLTENTHTGNTYMHEKHAHTENTRTGKTFTENTYTENAHTENAHTGKTHTENTHTENTHTENTHTVSKKDAAHVWRNRTVIITANIRQKKSCAEKIFWPHFSHLIYTAIFIVSFLKFDINLYYD